MSIGSIKWVVAVRYNPPAGCDQAVGIRADAASQREAPTIVSGDTVLAFDLFPLINDTAFASIFACRLPAPAVCVPSPAVAGIPIHLSD